jgi:hypothetical protein
MLTDAEKLILTVAVDGELSPDQTVAFQNLLAQRPEAVLLWEQLKADAERLKALPRHPAPAELTRAVMARIMTRTTPLSRGRRLAAWLPYALAASVLIGVAAGSYWFFRIPVESDLALTNSRPTHPGDPAPFSPLTFAKKSQASHPEAKAAPDLETVAMTKEETGIRGTVVESLPPPRTVVVPETPTLPGVFGSPSAEAKSIIEVNLKLPVIWNAMEWNENDAMSRLVKELGRDAAFRIDLFSKNPTAAIEQLQAAARAAKVNLFVEGTAAELLKRPNGIPLAVHFENLTAAELTALLAAVAQQVHTQPKPETILGSAHLFATTAVEQKDVKDLVGVELLAPKVTKSEDDPKSVSADTLPKIAAAVKKPDEKTAVVFPYLPPNVPSLRANVAKSAEVKQFLEKRGDRKPGTVPLLIVVRGM